MKKKLLGLLDWGVPFVAVILVVGVVLAISVLLGLIVYLPIWLFDHTFDYGIALAVATCAFSLVTIRVTTKTVVRPLINAAVMEVVAGIITFLLIGGSFFIGLFGGSILFLIVSTLCDYVRFQAEDAVNKEELHWMSRM